MLRSLSTRILIGFLVVATVPIASMAVWDAWTTRRAVLITASSELQGAAREVADRLDRYIDPRRAAVTLASRLIKGDAPLDAAVNRDALRLLHSEFPEFRTAALFDADGILRAVEPVDSGANATTSFLGQSFAHREYFQRAIRDTATVTTSVYRGRSVGNQVIVAFGRAIRDRSGTVRGVLQASLNLTRSGALVNSGPYSGVAYVVTDPAGVVAASKGDIPFQPLDTLDARAMRGRWGEVLAPGTAGDRLTTRDWLVARLRLAGGWQVIVERPMVSVLAESTAGRLAALRATGFALLLGVLFSFLLIRSIRRPLHRVKDWLQDFDVRADRSPPEVPANTPTEIRDVMTAMGILGERLRASYEEVERTAAERQTLNTQLNGVLRELDARVAARTAELQEALRRAEEASVTKSRFLANMSHELRTPLNSVIGFSTVLLKNRAGRLSRSELDLLERILVNGKHLLSLINDILDISKIEAGRMALDVEEADIVVLAHETISQLEGQVAGKPVVLRYEGPSHAPLMLTDVAKVRQILINLVGNAIKFTERGVVLVRVETDSSGAVTAIGVHDTGIGIQRNRLESIFLPFEQADTSTSRRFGGTGLGLAICRSLSEMLGGTLAVESVAGQGSSFRLIFGELPSEGLEGAARLKVNRAVAGMFVG
ncbi:MAG: ATP-binding protein [Gemmatimonadaceae bacterium]